MGDGLGRGTQECFELAFFLAESDDVALAPFGRVDRADFNFQQIVLDVSLHLLEPRLQLFAAWWGRRWRGCEQRLQRVPYLHDILLCCRWIVDGNILYQSKHIRRA